MCCRFLQHWLDPVKPLRCQLSGLQVHTLYFGVKFYAADPCKLLEEITRYENIMLMPPADLVLVAGLCVGGQSPGRYQRLFIIQRGPSFIHEGPNYQ